ncbi:O-antigen ligase family protein [Patescibacteria group bacterium]|nr:O-antigen ligase family protein [Patescibacteria group bacterium]
MKENTKLEQFITNLILIAIILCPFTARLTIETGFTIKMSEIVLITAFIFWLIKIIFFKSDPIYFGPMGLPLIGFLITAGLSLTKAVDLKSGVLIWCWTFVCIMGCYFLLINSVTNLRLLKTAISVLLLTSLSSALFAFYQFFADYVALPSGIWERYRYPLLGYPRVHAAFLEPQYFAHFILISIAFTTAFFIFKTNIPFFTSKLTAVTLFLSLLTLNFTFSRGGWLGLGSIIVITVLFFITLFLNKRHKSLLLETKKPLAGTCIIFASAMIMLIPSLFLGSQLLTLGNRIDQYSVNYIWNKKTTEQGLIGKLETETTKSAKKKVSVNPTITNLQTATEDGLGEEIPLLKFISDRLSFIASVGRFHHWRTAVKLFKRNPWLGVGIGNYGPLTQGEGIPIGEYNVANNQPLSILAETGLIGFFFYGWFNIAFLVVIIKNLYQSLIDRDNYWWSSFFLGTLLAFTALSVQYLLFSTINIIHFWILLALGTCGHQIFHKKSAV